jgi:hypothetical protein
MRLLKKSALQPAATLTAAAIAAIGCGALPNDSSFSSDDMAWKLAVIEHETSYGVKTRRSIPMRTHSTRSTERVPRRALRLAT